MFYIRNIVKDLAGGLNTDWSRIGAENPRREKLAKALCLKAFFRVTLAALAVFATFKLSLAPFLVLVSTAALSAPAAILFSAALMIKSVLFTANAIFITKASISVGLIFTSIIVNSLAAKVLIGCCQCYQIYQFFLVNIPILGILENRLIPVSVRLHDLARPQQQTTVATS